MSAANHHHFLELLTESNLRHSSVRGQMQSASHQHFDAAMSIAAPTFPSPVLDQHTPARNSPGPLQPPTPSRLTGEPAFCSGRHCCKWSVAGCACNNHYPSAEDLDRHVATEHAGRHADGQPCGDYHCYWTGCSKCESFGNKPKLTRHLHSHTGHKPHQCLYPDCGKGFVTKEQLKNHETTHTRTKGHVCPECGKGFAVKTALTSHRNVHKGAKPYVCEECGKGFADSSNLSKHKAIHKRVAVKKQRHTFHRLSMGSANNIKCTPLPPSTSLVDHSHTGHLLTDTLTQSIEDGDNHALCSIPCYDVQCADDDRIPCRSLSPCQTAPCSSTDCEPASFESCSMPPCDLPDCDYQHCDLPDCLQDCINFCDSELYDPSFYTSEDEVCGSTQSPALLQPSVTSQPSQQMLSNQVYPDHSFSHLNPQPFSSIAATTSHPDLGGMEYTTTEGFKQLHDFIHDDPEDPAHYAVRFG